jgi:membrane associated rhomboid family serine protease
MRGIEAAAWNADEQEREIVTGAHQELLTSADPVHERFENPARVNRLLAPLRHGEPVYILPQPGLRAGMFARFLIFWQRSGFTPPMQYTRYRHAGYFSGYFPPGVKWLLISNITVFVVNFFAALFLEHDPFRLFGLVPQEVLQSGCFWQLFTYMFLHGGFFHIVFNMFALWMFGITLEGDWGTRRFLQYYFLCGIGAALCVIAVSIPAHELMFRTIGASGAIYGLLLAFGVLYPDTPILFSFLFPIKAKYFVLIFGAIEFMSSFDRGSGVSHIAHLGGMLFGLVYLKGRLSRKRFAPLVTLRGQLHEWRVQRARKKFQVYLHKHDSDRDRWMN